VVVAEAYAKPLLIAGSREATRVAARAMILRLFCGSNRAVVGCRQAREIDHQQRVCLRKISERFLLGVREHCWCACALIVLISVLTGVPPAAFSWRI